MRGGGKTTVRGWMKKRHHQKQWRPKDFLHARRTKDLLKQKPVMFDDRPTYMTLPPERMHFQNAIN
jgi:hypothetical protein